ncbi:MAG: asparagine synthase (glutamine-hydrolyzing) [Pelagibacteraceae bacterium TMED124]|nr:asparagine synthase (glutamine-hydrolyzing) [Candidatus Neomarinimicrobiota bacterium]RPG17197.1 MAG: asparagine synthase (glutamine-hydrolyzing) [Pelagibacteraceae bacterium TMED124]|tara:strand:+ start:4677 stop:6626 length:1950 start_codon:yes stop_codon:yes gene_type:complete
MCGIAGIITQNKSNFFYLNKLKKMMLDIGHRGPDDKGIWSNNEKTVHLGHARLSIIDVSNKGSQPMPSKSGRYIISYNGEIYNHLELRTELNKIDKNEWNSSSDTETLLRIIEQYGIEKSLKKIKGMFAFSCYDKKLNKLFLCRDKFGEKPLYYGSIDNSFYFSSDLKNILLNNKNLHLNFDAINSFLMFSYIPSPQSILKNIFKLQSGNYIEIDVKKFNSGHKKYSIIHKWFDLNNEIKKANENQITDYKKCETEIESNLFNSVERQLISDVPLGSFLSGGIDSTLIALAIKNRSKKNIETFSIGFENKIYDESNKSSKVSKIIGMKNNKLIMKEKDMLNLIKYLPEIYSEPFGDSSSLPSIILSKFCKRKVKVCLSGDGGDELFAGYNRYNLTPNLWNKLKFFPINIRILLKKFLTNLSSDKRQKISNILLQNFSENEQKLEKFIDVLDSKSENDLLKNILSKSKNSFDLIENETKNNIIEESFKEHSLSVKTMMANDTKFYLSDDILCKVDRSSMYYGLETRVPFLDFDLFKKAWQVPLKFRKKKQLLNNIINKHINYDEIKGPKKGFSIPLKKWLSLSLRNTLDEYINEEILSKYPFFKKEKIIYLWNSYKKNKLVNEHLIWNIFILIQWLETYKKNLNTINFKR